MLRLLRLVVIPLIALLLLACNDSGQPAETTEEPSDPPAETAEATEAGANGPEEAEAPDAADQPAADSGEPATAEEPNNDAGDTAAAPDNTAPATVEEQHPGLAIYRGGTAPTCRSCHDRGIAGAPLLGDSADWADRSTDVEELLESTLSGKGAMPAYRGRADEDDLREAIRYMLSTLDAT